MRHSMTFALAFCLGACSSIPESAPPTGATAILQRGGAPVGRAALSQNGADVAITLTVDGLASGEYGMHLHQIGKCDGPDYKSAGPHWNPGNRQHGLNNPQGAHGGDLPNLVAVGGRPATYSGQIASIMLTGPSGLIDGDGAAIIIHAKADDGLTDPSGNSGDRIICGMLTLEN